LLVASADRADRPVPALIGNGELVTMLDRHGYHSPPGVQSSPFLDPQCLYIAGRRLAGPRHEMVPFGVVSRNLTYQGAEEPIALQEQSIHLDTGEVRSRTLRGKLLESTRTLIPLSGNVFLVETTLQNQADEPLDVALEITYSFTDRHGERDPELRVADDLSFETHDNLGRVYFQHDGPGTTVRDGLGVRARHTWWLQPGVAVTVRTWLVISDRITYQDPLDSQDLDELLTRNVEEWQRFWSRSSVETGDESVDRFRKVALYTLRCQATPWSIPPTVSRRWWDGGAFHDELYPFLGLLSGGYADLARNIPYYRLATLPKAVARARGRGALYAWSATEAGDERDPHGHWYTERFHLGQFAATVWWLWLYQEDMAELEDLYPVLREIARYFELQMIETSPDGKVRTKRCTDFDESVGQVSGGPMTMGAAIYSLERATEAARRLGRERERSRRWERLAHRLRDSLPVDRTEKRYAIPDGKDLHYSIVGMVFPFAVDAGSEYARNTLRMIHERARTDFGWKPGWNPAFDDSVWMWTAGHLGMCHSMVGDGERAWDCVRTGPESASQFHSPNEHLKNGVPVVPWFTTGCGAWLAALHWMFVRVDDDGMHLLPAIPESLSNFRFHGLAGASGVTVACEVKDGKLASLSMTSRVPQALTFQLPKCFLPTMQAIAIGEHDDFGETWRFRVNLDPGENCLL